MNYNIINGNALDNFKNIKDKSVDLVLMDPPYNVKKAKWDTWKTIEDYVEFMGKIFIECERVLKKNGSMYFFHNDFLQIAELQHWIRNNTNFKFNSFIIWDKKDFRALGWKKPSKKNTLRSWFNTCEYCLYYTFQDKTGMQEIMSNEDNFKPIKKYLLEEKKKLGVTTNWLINNSDKYLNKKNSAISHYFANSQFILPSKDVYENYLQKLNSECFKKPYQELKEEFEELKLSYEDGRLDIESQRYTHNLDERHNNIWYSDERNNGKLHPTQKPIDILERIIKTSSNKEDTVLDCFMGSGSTGVACMNTNRNFIGIELEEKYYNISKERIEKAKIKKELVL